MADETLRGPLQVVQTYAEADFLDDLVGVFGIDVVLNGFLAPLGEVCRRNLHQVGDFGLRVSVSQSRLHLDDDTWWGETYQDEHADSTRQAHFRVTVCIETFLISCSRASRYWSSVIRKRILNPIWGLSATTKHFEWLV